MPPRGPRSEARERAKRAYQLRCQHKTWDDIAAACGYASPASACKAVIRHIQRMPPEEAEMARALAAGTYRNVISKLYEVAEDAHRRGKHTPAVQALEAIANVQERHNKLLGIQPVATTEVNVNVAPIEELRTRLLDALKARADRAEIVDAEVVEIPGLPRTARA